MVFPHFDNTGPLKLVEYYATDCGYCQQMAPVWKLLSKSHDVTTPASLQILQKQCYGPNWSSGPDSNYCNAHNVDKFPTIQLLDKNDKVISTFPGINSLNDDGSIATDQDKVEQILNFANNYTSHEMQADNPDAITSESSMPWDSTNIIFLMSQLLSKRKENLNQFL